MIGDILRASINALSRRDATKPAKAAEIQPLWTGPGRYLMRRPHGFVERNRSDELMMLVLYLDERGRVQDAVQKLSRKDIAQPGDSCPACRAQIGIVLPFNILSEADAIRDVKVEYGHMR